MNASTAAKRAAALAAIAVTSALAAPARAAEAPAADLYAIVIGHNGGNAELPRLAHADDDAVRFASLFGGLGARRVWLLTTVDDESREQLARAGIQPRLWGPPTRRAVLATFADAAREIAARKHTQPPALYVIYAGHGLRGRVLLQPETSVEAALTGDELRASLAQVVDADERARLFVFLDACRSQSLFSDRGAAGPDLGEAVRALDRRARAVHIGVLTAARSGRPAGEVRALGAGYFSHVLASGLAGAADADGDERITFGEIAAFVSFHTQRLTGQMPWFEPPAGDLHANALDHRGRRSRLVLDGSGSGHLVVSATTGAPVFVEAFKPRARPLRLVLPAGNYRVVRDSAEHGAEETTIALGAGAAVALDHATWHGAIAAPPTPRGEGDTSLQLTEPFSPEIVATLMAGYESGRSPSLRPTTGGQRLAVGADVARAPLGLRGVEPALAVAYRYQPERFALGVRAFAATSSHVAGAEAYDLRRVGLVVEAGWGMRLATTWEALAFLGAGAATTLRSTSGSTTGDAWGPLIAAGLGVEWHAYRGFGFFGELRWTAHFIDVAGGAELSQTPIGSLGVSAWF